ncbi:MAG: hypothetical protein AAGA77_01715 [Bacteroidota bacterium]
MIYNVRLSHNRNDVRGSYYLFDGKSNDIGRSQGYTVTKRYITYQSSISNTLFRIMKRGWKKYVLFNKDEIFGVVKIYFLYHKVEVFLSN